MATIDKWMPVWIGDYIKDTSRLTTVQHGAYFLLLCDSWVNGPLPNDDSVLASITKMSVDEWMQHKPTIMAFFKLKSGKWTNKRLEVERKAAQKRSEAGKKAAAKRWGNDD